MGHTPTTPVQDDRPLKILERTPVDDDHKQRLYAIVKQAQQVATDAGKELQAEFGKEAVAMIVACNQFVRLFRGGEMPGAVEFLLPGDAKQALAEAGYEFMEPDGAIFKMFGWIRVNPMQGELQPLLDATIAAFGKQNTA